MPKAFYETLMQFFLQNMYSTRKSECFSESRNFTQKKHSEFHFHGTQMETKFPSVWMPWKRINTIPSSFSPLSMNN